MTSPVKEYNKRWKKCWDVAPDIHIMLRESKNLESARQKMKNYMNANETAFRNDFFELTNWEFILFRDALGVIKSIFSRRTERMANSSPLKYLWDAARNGDSEVKDDFIDEFEHLFRAIKGHSKVYPSFLMRKGVVSPDFDKYKGRDAAIRRSNFLNILGSEMDDFLDKYPNGLASDVIERRKKNKAKILKVFNADPADWNNYKWHFRNAIKDGAGLKKLNKIIKLSNTQEKAVKMAVHYKIPFGITPHYLHLMDESPSDFDYAVRSQVIPTLKLVEAMNLNKKGRSRQFDFMREYDTSPVDHITRRYAKVCILKPYDTCPQICVYCQRNWEITSPTGKLVEASKSQFDKTIKWLQKQTQIMDVLVTGGDPLIMNNASLDQLLKQLSEITHIKSIRIASRVPVTAPQRLDEELGDILEKYNEFGKRLIYFVTHFQHPYEISTDSAINIDRIKKKGISFYNQQVFSFANSRRFESVALRIALKMIGVDPYYIFNMKGKSELSELSAPIARVLQENREEARLLPGIYRTDEPVFNVPFLGKNHMRAQRDHELISILPSGERVYAFHPWEKNIRGVDSYLYTDVPIKSYLNKLRDRDEDPDDYRSIWYYY